MATRKEIHSDLAVPPGEFLGEVMSTLGITEYEVARHVGLSVAELGQIFKGSKVITRATATQLETAVGVPANIWLGLECEYRLALTYEPREDQAENR